MKNFVIPPSERAGLSRVEAAEYIGVGVTLFDQMVADGRMPPPRQANARLLWSRVEVEKWFLALPYADVRGQSIESAATDEWAV